MRHAYIAALILIAAVGGGAVSRADDAPLRQVWIYRDDPGARDSRSPTERLFSPYGIMPAERAA